MGVGNDNIVITDPGLYVISFKVNLVADAGDKTFALFLDATEIPGSAVTVPDSGTTAGMTVFTKVNAGQVLTIRNTGAQTATFEAGIDGTCAQLSIGKVK